MNILTSKAYYQINSFYEKINTPTLFTWVSNIVVILAMCASILPMFILGENFIFTIHDELDSLQLYSQLAKDLSCSIWPWSPIPFAGETPFFMTGLDYSLGFLPNFFFDYITAQQLLRVYSVFVAFFSMYYLLMYFSEVQPTEKQKALLKLTSLAFALLPFRTFRTVSFATLPLWILIFCILSKKKSFDARSMLVGFLAFFTAGPALGFFATILWFLVTIGHAMYKRCINKNLLSAFISLCLGYALVSYNAFAILLSGVESNRHLLSFYNENFFDVIKKYLLHGDYFVPAIQSPIIIWIVAITLILSILSLFSPLKKKLILNKKLSSCIILFSSIVCINLCLAAVYLSGLSITILQFLHLDFLIGFNFSRMVHLNAVIWYVLCGLAILQISRVRYLDIIFLIVLCIQVSLVFNSKEIYNDKKINCKNLYVTCLYGDDHKKIISKVKDIRYNEFFDFKNFDNIKKMIGYVNTEKAVAVGMHPSVLMQNGIRTVDSYMSTHTMEWHQKFRKLIAPALDRDESFQKYYDTWGGRMYLYCRDIKFQPTRQKIDGGNLYIDPASMKLLDIKYIFSRAKIHNYKELGLKSLGMFGDDTTFYDIYVYTPCVLH